MIVSYNVNSVTKLAEKSEYKAHIAVANVNTTYIDSIKDKKLRTGEMLLDKNFNILRIGDNKTSIKNLPVFAAPQNDVVDDVDGRKILLRDNGVWKLVDE